MNTTTEDKGVTEFGFTKPAIYQIEVQGVINEQSSGYFYELDISVVNEPGYKPISIVTGLVKDQSDLLGILNTLNNLHFPILSIKTINNDKIKDKH